MPGPAASLLRAAGVLPSLSMALERACGMLLVYSGGLLRTKTSFQWLLFSFSGSVAPCAPRVGAVGRTPSPRGQWLVRFGKLAAALLAAMFSALCGEVP